MSLPYNILDYVCVICILYFLYFRMFQFNLNYPCDMPYHIVETFSAL